MASLVLIVCIFIATAAAAQQSMVNSANAGRARRVRRSASCIHVQPSVESLALKDAFVAAHNTARGRVKPTAANMAKMVWNQKLAELAQWSANQCKFEHNNHVGCKVDDETVGQNIYIKYGHAVPSATEVVLDNWENEKKDYTYSPDNAGTCTDLITGCKHYTQVAWAASQAVGCAYQTCSNVKVGTSTYVTATLTVCNYGPLYMLGNIYGKSPYVPGASCSKCETNHGYYCESNLCVECRPKDLPNKCKCGLSKSICEKHGTFVQGECICKCNPSYYGRTCSDKCEDKTSFCNQWKASCKDPYYVQFMTETCPKSCGVCS